MLGEDGIVKILAVVGARPNFMKIAPILWELARRPGLEACLVHTGQHYDLRMSTLFFEDLHIPRPDIDLGVGSGSHATQTAEVLKRFEPVLIAEKPDLVMVVGDVNSTLACALAAAKLSIPVAHVEAGLRSFDRTMPEEVNRILTDAISDWLFVTERSGLINLRNEGVPEEKIHFVGNVMIDTLFAVGHRAERSTIIEDLGVRPGAYPVLTLHRPANVDGADVLAGLMRAVGRIQESIPVVFPVHPRTRGVLGPAVEAFPHLHLCEPLGYPDFMKLLRHARLVLTDSGGIQEETTVLGVPCLTLRNNTERPVTVEQGTNVLVGLTPERIVSAAVAALLHSPRRTALPELWDGRAAVRLLDVLEKSLSRPIALAV